MLGLPLRPKSILCLGAHSDDIEIGCGGTLLQLLEAGGIHVYWAVFSSSDARREEAFASSQAFLKAAGAKTVVVKNFRDSFFPSAYDEIKECFSQIRAEIEPDLIFTHRRDDAHQDHRLLAELTWCTFRNHLVLEYEIPKYEGDLGAPNVFVPLAEATCQAKIDNLLAAFPTQRNKPWFTPDAFWALLRLRGLESNSPSKFAEGFYCRKLVVG